MKPLCYLNSLKSNARDVLSAFAKGSGADITTEFALVPGRPAVFYGVDAHTEALYREVQARRHPHFYIDNGYFRSRWQGGAYYRVTRDRPQHDGIPPVVETEQDGARWAALERSIKPWRKDGNYVLVAVQSDYWHIRHGHGGAERFADGVTAQLAKHTRRPVIVRGKPLKGHSEPPLLEQIRGAWAIVTHTSNVAVDGLIEGIPCFPLAQCAAWVMGQSDLSRIESPHYDERRLVWAETLANNQWTLDELRDGTCWRAVQ